MCVSSGCGFIYFICFLRFYCCTGFLIYKKELKVVWVGSERKIGRTCGRENIKIYLNLKFLSNTNIVKYKKAV